ncbi:MAG: response regulator [Leptolyngbya sp. SIO4C5]|uniref:sigma-54-dependent transcriptional regulator n=1 Tax=Sphaerothrix gracilis TaxID=3151835 RepID=UPI0013C29D3C|nr:response regulator [Leptolyngbya sp. SIO4C5]
MSKAKLLVADDEKNIRLTVAQSLDAQYEVKTAVSGQDALDQLAKDTFDLMLLDIRMPGMDGVEVLKQLKDRQPDLKVIVISAHGTVDSAVEVMKLGAVDFLQKPFTPQEIRDLVAQVLGRSLQPQDTSSYDDLMAAAKAQASQRNFDAAISQVKQAIGAHPERPEAFNFLGELLEVKGDRLEALKNYRVALDLDPTYEPAQQNLHRATRNPKTRPSL